MDLSRDVRQNRRTTHRRSSAFSLLSDQHSGVIMWYFNWILGIGLALAFGIINVMWLEANYAFGERDEAATQERFKLSRQNEEGASN